MKLLFDQNLSRRLVAMLSVETRRAGTSPKSGSTRRPTPRSGRMPEEHGFVIVSKDSDFRQLAFLHGPPPKAIWVRLGNASTIEIFDVLRGGHDEILRCGADADEALLVLP